MLSIVTLLDFRLLLVTRKIGSQITGSQLSYGCFKTGKHVFNNYFIVFQRLHCNLQSVWLEINSSSNLPLLFCSLADLISAASTLTKAAVSSFADFLIVEHLNAWPYLL